MVTTIKALRTTPSGSVREVELNVGQENLGTLNPASGLSVSVQRVGSFMALLTFTLADVQLTVTDAAGSGSSASLKLFDFAPQGVVALACRQDYTAFTEGAALTTAAGDAVHLLALGSVAANAGDGALTGTEVDIGAATAQITNSAGTGVATKYSCAAAVFDGTSTPVDLFLNWSGTATTIDANSTIGVTGTIAVLVALLGDD